MSEPPPQVVFVPPEPSDLAKLFPSYQILDLIATGGMGAVYRAMQKSLDRMVAIKILPTEFSEDAEFFSGFEAEAKAMAQLSHPNLIAIHDFGVVEGIPYIIMEYVDGKSLFHSAHQKAIDPKQAVGIVLKIAGGIAHAHAAGIVHRDIKPANILLNRNAEPKIGDFGLASRTGADGLCMGTPGYMAPEVIAQPNLADARGDIFSVGAILYELLTGTLPGLDGTPPSSNTKVNAALDKICAKARHPDPAERYQDMESLFNDLAKWQSGVKEGAAMPRGAVSRNATERTRPPKKSSSGYLSGMVLKLFIIAALLVAVTFLWRELEKRKAETASVPKDHLEESENASLHVPTGPVDPTLPNHDPASPDDLTNGSSDSATGTEAVANSGFSEFEGFWTVNFKSGFSDKYTIDHAGRVTIQSRKDEVRQLYRLDDDVMMEFFRSLDDNRKSIQRFSFHQDKLVVEHWLPANRYSEGVAPGDSGVSEETLTKATTPAISPEKSATYFDAADLSSLRGKIGQHATVRGKVLRVGVNLTGTIRFLNFTEPFGDSVAVMMLVRDGPDQFTESRLEQYLEKSIEFSGIVAEHNGTLQIRIRSLAELKILEGQQSTASNPGTSPSKSIPTAGETADLPALFPEASTWKGIWQVGGGVELAVRGVVESVDTAKARIILDSDRGNWICVVENGPSGGLRVAEVLLAGKPRYSKLDVAGSYERGSDQATFKGAGTVDGGTNALEQIRCVLSRTKESGTTEIRAWSSTSGSRIIGSIVTKSEDSVTIRKTGGDQVTVALSLLSDEDKEFAKQWKDPIDEGLIYHCNFDADNADDLTGGGNNGIMTGTTPGLPRPGHDGFSRIFNGKPDRISVRTDIGPAIYPELTISVWARPANPIRSGKIISHDNRGYDRTLGIDTRGAKSAGKLQWAAFCGSGSVLGSEGVSSHDWVHLAVVYNQKTEDVTLYVNGRKYAGKGKLGAGKTYFNIGSNPGFGDHFVGAIDDVRIYSRALTDDEIGILLRK